MPTSSNYWKINRASQFHYRQWPDGVAVYLEGEGATYLLNPFAADLLKWLDVGRLTTQAIAERLLTQYPDDTLENISTTVEETLAELRLRGFVFRADTKEESGK